MAHYELGLSGDVDALAAHLDRAIPKGSISANVEDGSNYRIGDARMLVRIYERYSMTGGNRVSLTIAILAVGTDMIVSATTSGGSQAVFLKVNTFGEKAFLDRAIDALHTFAGL